MTPLRSATQSDGARSLIRAHDTEVIAKVGERPNGHIDVFSREPFRSKRPRSGGPQDTLMPERP